MSLREIVVVGAGSRVQKDVLPAISSLRSSLSLRSIFSRSAKEISGDGRAHRVRELSTLTTSDVVDRPLIYVGIEPGAVPGVIRKLLELTGGNADLLIDTPVFRPAKVSQVSLLNRFASVFAAEDIAFLPWLDTVRRAESHYSFGRPARLLLDRCSYAYHGIALAKSLLRDRSVRSARRERGTVIRFRFSTGAICEAIYPRDYAQAHLRIAYDNGLLSDTADSGAIQIAPFMVSGRVTGFRAGAVQTALTDEEVALLSSTADSAKVENIMAGMHDFKRLGLRRLLSMVATGKPGYPLVDAIDDMWIDFVCTRFGLWFDSFLTSPRHAICRKLSRLMG